MHVASPVSAPDGRVMAELARIRRTTLLAPSAANLVGASVVVSARPVAVRPLRLCARRPTVRRIGHRFGSFDCFGADYRSGDETVARALVDVVKGILQLVDAAALTDRRRYRVGK